MTASYAPSSLPDPATQAEFYEGVPYKRLLAWVVDAIIISAITVVVVPFTAFTAIFYLPFLVMIISFIYRWLTIASRSSTWGMRLLAIEFRNDAGHRLDSGEAALHTLGYSLSWAIFPAQLASAIMMCVTERGQGLTDFALNTTAINKPAA
jgi:uncharacterized RDD family membrane protein YckC